MSHLQAGGLQSSPHLELTETALNPQCSDCLPLGQGPEDHLAAAGDQPIEALCLGICGCHHTNKSRLARVVSKDTSGISAPGLVLSPSVHVHECHKSHVLT